MSTPRHSRNPSSRVLCPVSLAELLAIALFVVGPQAGSIDDDGYRNPKEKERHALSKLSIRFCGNSVVALELERNKSCA
jgi:hypothetical protein